MHVHQTCLNRSTCNARHSRMFQGDLMKSFFIRYNVYRFVSVDLNCLEGPAFGTQGVAYIRYPVENY